MLLFFSLLFVFELSPKFALAQSGGEWKIKKTSWTAQDEKNYQSFVMRLGQKVESRGCNTVTGCFNSDANIYRQSDPNGLKYQADCADFPYYVRGYFAWKNGLPFSMAISMNPRPVPGNSATDLRYSRFGNEVASKFSSAAKNGKFPNIFAFFNSTIANQADSGNYRVNYTGNDSGPLFTEFYPLKISRDSIRVGSILYDPNGHVALIYKINPDGKLYYVDAHPDNSLTYGAFGVKFVRSHPGQGAGFKDWRPLELVGATQDQAGNFVGGEIRGVKNANLPKYGVEQFFGNVPQQAMDWTKAQYSSNGQKVTYHEYVRIKMADGNLKINPVEDFKATLADLCVTVSDRVGAVDRAVKAGTDRKAHPARLPENIYGTQGEWEEYSTPSRDAQLKVSFRDLIDQSARYFEKLAKGDPTIVYSGDVPTLSRDLLQVYRNESASCQISYTNSAGSGVTLSLEEIRKRLFALSFDPYHCVELRWGARAGELSSCVADSNKNLWYQREQQFRNQHQRRYDVKMDFTLDEIAVLRPPMGAANPIDVDVESYLLSIHQ